MPVYKNRILSVARTLHNTYKLLVYQMANDGTERRIIGIMDGAKHSGERGENLITKQHPRTWNCRGVVKVFGEPKRSYSCRIHFVYSVVRLQLHAVCAALRNAVPSTMRYLLAVK